MIEFKYIKANNIKDEKSLSNAFTKILEYKYKKTGSIAELNRIINDANNTFEAHVNDTHVTDINSKLGKIIDSKKCSIHLKSDLSFEVLLKNVVKYFYKEKGKIIPENQFGLGYTNLILIVAELIEYIEHKNGSAFNSQINIICIEEPETYMHPQMQESFIKNINEMITFILNEESNNINAQIIITSHSAHILNSKIQIGNSFDNILYIIDSNESAKMINLNDIKISYNKDEQAKFKKLEKMYAKKKDTKLDIEIKELEKELDIYKKKLELSFIKKHMKFNVSEVFFSEGIIFVEGPCEHTLIKDYIDKKEDFNSKYITIVLIDGAHALKYKNLIELLEIPSLIITDIDIEREKKTDDNKEDYTQIQTLVDKKSTNSTLNFYFDKHSKKDLANVDYIEENNLKIVFQKDIIGQYYATSFEEALILTNFNNESFKKIIADIKPDFSKQYDLEKKSYFWQVKLANDKTKLANNILFENITIRNNTTNAQSSDQVEIELPKYIKDGLTFLKSKFEV